MQRCPYGNDTIVGWELFSRVGAGVRRIASRSGDVTTDGRLCLVIVIAYATTPGSLAPAEWPSCTDGQAGQGRVPRAHRSCPGAVGQFAEHHRGKAVAPVVLTAAAGHQSPPSQDLRAWFEMQSPASRPGCPPFNHLSLGASTASSVTSPLCEIAKGTPGPVIVSSLSSF